MVEDNLLKKINQVKVSINETDVFDRLLDKLRWPKQYPWGQPSIEAINVDGSKDQNFFGDDGYVDSDECIKRYEEGYALILSNIGGFTLQTWMIQQYLNKYFNKEINCNFYFGNGTKSISFKKHSHDYPVLVKNIYGTSKWIIDGKEVLLQSQDAIWFDSFTPHEVVEIVNPKLSMTCNIE
tara:strand:- start:409 stop:951 length:543 start_codon:yes stop_codon:yes gene_type:complete